MMKHLLTIGLMVITTHLCSQSLVTFKVLDIPETDGKKVGIRGNVSPLSWEQSLVLDQQGDAYVTKIQFDTPVTELEYKYVIFDNDAQVTWENTPNRTLSLSTLEKDRVEVGRWNREQVLDISQLDKIDASLLLKDYQLIESLVLEVHPGTYRYNSVENIQRALDELKERFSQPLTHQQAYLAISKLTALLQCDHTKAGFNNQTKIINSIIHHQSDKVPFTFKWMGNEMIVIYNAAESPLLTRGTKIRAINGVGVTEIKEKMMPYIGADGATDKNRVYKMEVNGYDFRYNAFDVFYPLLFPIPDQKLTLEIQRPNTSAVETVEVRSLNREDRSEILATRYQDFPKTRDDMWKFEILSDTIAVLTLNSFGLSGWKAMTLDYKAFLAQAFQQMRDQEVSHLIIDIRENNGGNDEMAHELFSYLTDDYPAYSREGRTRYLSFPAILKPHIRTWGDEPWFYELNPKDRNPSNGYYIFKENFENDQLANHKPLFEGHLYLLTSAANTSLAYYTALRFKTQQLGTIIGEETGGNLNGINGGQIIFITLPHSQIEIDSPVMGEFTTPHGVNSGVLPDISTAYTIADILFDRDLALEEALNQIRNK